MHGKGASPTGGAPFQIPVALAETKSNALESSEKNLRARLVRSLERTRAAEAVIDQDKVDLAESQSAIDRIPRDLEVVNEYLKNSITGREAVSSLPTRVRSQDLAVAGHAAGAGAAPDDPGRGPRLPRWAHRARVSGTANELGGG